MRLRLIIHTRKSSDTEARNTHSLYCYISPGLQYQQMLPRTCSTSPTHTVCGTPSPDALIPVRIDTPSPAHSCQNRPSPSLPKKRMPGIAPSPTQKKKKQQTCQNRRLHGRSIRDRLIRVDRLVQFTAPEEVRQQLLHPRDARRPANQHNVIDSALVHLGVLQRSLDRLKGAPVIGFWCISLRLCHYSRTYLCNIRPLVFAVRIQCKANRSPRIW